MNCELLSLRLKKRLSGHTQTPTNAKTQTCEPDAINGIALECRTQNINSIRHEFVNAFAAWLRIEEANTNEQTKNLNALE